jgi:hypothetical protein
MIRVPGLPRLLLAVYDGGIESHQGKGEIA